MLLHALDMGSYTCCVCNCIVFSDAHSVQYCAKWNKFPRALYNGVLNVSDIL